MKSLVLALVSVISAQATDLDELRATQQKLAAARDFNKLPREEVPLEAVASARRQLLSWAESRLQTFGRNAEPGVLTETLSKELDHAIQPVPHVDDLDRQGDLGLGFSRREGEPYWLQLNTNIGIQCGFDQSVYLFEWRGNRWNRRFAIEANDHSKNEYDPEQSVELQMSSAGPDGSRLVLATASPPSCISNWHTLYIRLFRVGAEQTLLLKETPFAYLAEDPAYSARLEPAGALIEFPGSSIDSNYLVRRYVLHYILDGDEVKRIEPIALSPRDFVEEWLTRPWTEIAEWSEPGLAGWHTRLHRDLVSGEFDSVKRCAEPGAWQVSIGFDGKTEYFSLLDRGRGRYRMLRVGDLPQPDCRGENELLR